ncbi:MAG: hypothetical protein QXD13_01135 [Candidatus Pacearchaeota archaeon]
MTKTSLIRKPKVIECEERNLDVFRLKDLKARLRTSSILKSENTEIDIIRIRGNYFIGLTRLPNQQIQRRGFYTVGDMIVPDLGNDEIIGVIEGDSLYQKYDDILRRRGR